MTASTLWKLKDGDLAWLAAERGLVLAEETGDSLLISDAARRVVQGLTVMGHYDQALDLVRADIDRLEPGRGSGSPAYLSLTHAVPDGRGGRGPREQAGDGP